MSCSAWGVCACYTAHIRREYLQIDDAVKGEENYTILCEGSRPTSAPMLPKVEAGTKDYRDAYQTLDVATEVEEETI